MKFFRKLWKYRRILRSLFPTIYFNFRYLPFGQAIKLPILLYKPKFYKLKGSITIESSQISFGMVQWGFNSVSLYPNTGIHIEIHGQGRIIIQGKCTIGNASALSIGENGVLIFGDSFTSYTSLHLVAYHRIEFKENAFIGWETTCMDTDFYKLTKLSGGCTIGFGPIVIGSNCWLGLKCTVLKNTKLPDYSVVGGNSVLSRDYTVDVPSYSLLAGNPAVLRKTGVYRKDGDDFIDYE